MQFAKRLDAQASVHWATVHKLVAAKQAEGVGLMAVEMKVAVTAVTAVLAGWARLAAVTGMAVAMDPVAVAGAEW